MTAVAEMTNMTLKGTLKAREPMSRHTSWRAGGVAERFYQPADLDDLARALGSGELQSPLTVIGLGSNLLVRDGGLRGTVVCTVGALKDLTLLAPGVVRAEAGVAGAQVARFSVKSKLNGAQFLAGIPGTVGGMLAMNAGAFGGETWRIVKAVEVMDASGRISVRRPHEFEIGYRHVAGLGQDEWFVAAHFALAAARPDDNVLDIRTLLDQRAELQPVKTWNAGSVFKNPEGDHAARLIESCGLKGLRRGGAVVSEKHANFIINEGEATAADIEWLIEHIRDTVKTETGVLLEPEVRIVGEPA
ncbi:MAG: UDP-N-acetylenolpyruvoylglucosamine reductase [Gammaproteobacteria bacterium]|nr:MAG: UDP-N-acetylenolpyruvoylglucosamine reductase [Gammaproteobacteria bacterium]